MNKLTELRKARHLTQTELAKILNVARNTISQWETGKRNPDLDTVVKIANYFDVTVDFLIGGNDKRAPTQWQNTTQADKAPSLKNENLRLKALRKQNNMTQKDIAKLTGYQQTLISKWESDEREPDIETLKRLANYFNVTVDYLVGNDAPENTRQHENSILKNASQAQKELIKRVLENSDLICDTVSTYLDGVLAGKSIFDKNNKNDLRNQT